MDFPNDLIDKLNPTQTRIALEITGGLLCSIALACAGVIYRIVRKGIQSIDTRTQKIEQRVEHMSTNCFPTIQANTGKTNELLERLIEGQAEMTGYIKGRFNK